MFRTVLRTLYSSKCLVVTNSVTGMAFMAVGDAIQQCLGSGAAFDGRRNVHMMFGGLYFGHYWYSLLDRRFPGRHASSVVKKLSAEAVMGPPVVCTMFVVVGHLRGLFLAKVWDDLKANIRLICLAEWLAYLPLQVVNFAVIAPQFRYLFVSVVSVVYDAFLSFLVHRGDDDRGRESEIKDIIE